MFNRAWQRLRRCFAKKGVRRLTLHSARHTWATLALQAGKSIKWIADQLGHSDPAFTLRIYAHSLPDESQDLGFLDFEAGCSMSSSTATAGSMRIPIAEQRIEAVDETAAPLRSGTAS